jgi:hypothetical protein
MSSVSPVRSSPTTPSRSQHSHGSSRTSPVHRSIQRSPRRLHQLVVYEDTPVIATPPRKKHKTALSQEEMLRRFTDQEIIGVFILSSTLSSRFISIFDIDLESKRLLSDVYQHYDFSIECDQGANTITHIFTCKYGDSKHKTIRRLHAKVHEGTTNLRRSAAHCDERHQVTHQALVQGSATVSTNVSMLYSASRHRAILAMWCATSARLPRMIMDKYHAMEVSFLRPGTTLPSEKTVARDMKLLHAGLATQAKDILVVSCSLLLSYQSLIPLFSAGVAGFMPVLTDGPAQLHLLFLILT